MFDRKKAVASLGTAAAILFVSTFPLADAAATTAIVSPVVRTVKAYKAPNGKIFSVVLLKNGKFAYKPKGGKVSAVTFASSAAVLKFIETTNKKISAPAAGPIVGKPAPVVAPVKPAPIIAPVTAPAPADTITRAS